MRDVAKAADCRHVALQRPSLLAACVVAASFQWLAAGYREPDSEDTPCTDSRKEGCHGSVLLAVAASGKLLTKDVAQGRVAGQTADDPPNGSKKPTVDEMKMLEAMIFDEEDAEARGIARLFAGDLKAILDIPFMLGSMIILCMLIRVFTSAASGSPGAVYGEHQALSINVGHILTCAAEEAEIYAKVDSSDVIGKVPRGEDLLVDGEPVEHGGTLMVPVKPEGAVKLELFTTNRAANIQEGTTLVCIGDESHPADVYVSATTTRMLARKIRRGEKIVAAGKPEWVDGYMMLHIKPLGAVEADLFEILEAGAGEVPDGSAPAEEKAEDVPDTPEAVEIKERMKQLKKEKTRLMFEQASRKEHLTTVLKSIMDAEAELEGLTPPSEEEAQRKAEEAMRSMDSMAEKGVMSAILYAAPIMMQSKRIYSKLEERLQRTQESARKLATQEATNLMTDIQSLAGLTDLVVDQSVLDHLNAPSLAAIVASALAPAQLRILHFFSGTALVFSMTFMLMDVSVVAWDWQVPCLNKPEQINRGMKLQMIMNIWWKNSSTNAMYLWFFIDFFVHLFCFLIRWRVTKVVGTLLETINRPPPVQLVEHPMDALRLILEYYLSTGAESLVELDNVMDSWSLYFASWSVCFDTIWLIYAVDVVWNTPWIDCTAIGLLILRIRSMFFLMLFVVYVLQIVGFMLSQLFQSQAFSLAVLQGADKADTALQLGIPLFRILVQALVVRSSSDMIAIQLNIHQQERDNLQRRKEKLQRDLSDVEQKEESSKEAMEKLNIEKMALSERYADTAARAEEFLRVKQELLDSSQKFFDDIKKKTAEVAARAEQQYEEMQRDGIDTSEWTSGLASLQEQALSASDAAAAMGAQNVSMDGMMAYAQEASQAAQDVAASSGIPADMATLQAAQDAAAKAAQDAAASSGISADMVTLQAAQDAAATSGAAGFLQDAGAGAAGAASGFLGDTAKAASVDADVGSKSNQ
mmetsp:Transcript_108071/g.196688  ORF Transcript_108071/g.196688 Transcript_108071/m.196688 type:complete len:979 (+) Transcript_108071:132-3068(+)